MIRGVDTYQFVKDHLGSIKLVVKVSDGSVAQEITYDEFGKVLSDTNPGFQPFGFAGGDANLYGYVLMDPVNLVDISGMASTRVINTRGGRSVLDGPTNGNWGGGCWSGGQYSCGDKGLGNAPAMDSGDECYKAHDECYSSCVHGGNSTCDGDLSKCLGGLPADSSKWPNPPAPGATKSSELYRRGAELIFGK